jgi:DNA replication protein DnaC
MQIQTELKTTLKQLKLSGLLPTMPDRLSYARKEKLDYTEFLELVLRDEVERREHKRIGNRLRDAGFEQECTLESFDFSAQIRVDKARLTDLFGLHFIEKHQNVIFTGPVGVGKTFMACALGHGACRAGYRVLFVRADKLTKDLARSRADNSFDKQLRRLLVPDLLIVDDFGLRKLSGQACSDFYDLIVERHTKSSTILTSNRAVEEWMAVFDEPLLGQSALDRFCHHAHQLVIEGESYRKRIAPGSGSHRKGAHKGEPCDKG